MKTAEFICLLLLS